MNVQLETGSGATKRGGGPQTSQDFEDFIYLISHDVRNSVRALIEVPQWIAEDLAESGHRIEGALAENIDLMNTHTRRLDRMLNDLLIYSRIGRMQDVRDVDLAGALETVVEDARLPPGFRLVHDLRQSDLRVGEHDIMTLLTALVANSVRHRDRETGEIRVESWQDGTETVLTYRDDGPGIPLEFRSRVFGAMTTLKSRDEVEGSGMGLAHVKKIVTTYGGTLRWLDLPGGRGVGFEMRFPR